MFELIVGSIVGVAGIKIYNKFNFVKTYCDKISQNIYRIYKDWKQEQEERNKRHEMQIVEFEDSEGYKYAIRKYISGFDSYKYKGLNNNDWWSREYVESYCIGTLKQCEKEMKRLEENNNMGTPIKGGNNV